MDDKRVQKLRELIQEKIPQDIVSLEPVEHRYVNKNDLFRKYRSTTTKLQIISNPKHITWRMNRALEYLFIHKDEITKDNFAEFLKKAKEYPEIEFQAAGTRGTSAHDVVESYLKQWIATNERPKDIRSFCEGIKDPMVWSAARSFEAVVVKLGAIPLASELILWEDFKCKDKKCDHRNEETCQNYWGVAGSMDEVMLVGEDIEFWDTKTSNQYDDNYHLQLGNYSRMFRRFIPRLPVKRGRIVKLDKEHGDAEKLEVIEDLKSRGKEWLMVGKVYDIYQELRGERKENSRRTIKMT